MKGALLVLLFTLSFLTVSAQDQPHQTTQQLRPIFLHSTCDGKLAPAVLSSFKEAISASQRWELVPNLSDNGKNDVVYTVDMICGERNNAVSIASIYGAAKCFSPTNCHVAVDGHTLNILMCDPNGEAQCGKELFKEFEYVLATTHITVKLQ